MNVMLVSEWGCACISYCGLQQGAVGVWKHNTGHACDGHPGPQPGHLWFVPEDAPISGWQQEWTIC